LRQEAGIGRDTETHDSPVDLATTRAMRAALDAQRQVVLRLRDGGRLDDERAAKLEAEIDVDAMALCSASGELLWSLPAIMASKPSRATLAASAA
jgi:hypothetical protein